MSNSQLITQAEIKRLLNYNPDTGVFTWRVGRRGKAKVGSVAGFTKSKGYILIKVNNTSYFGHRLAWFYITGAWPQHQIDHVDGNPSNNSWVNLRAASHKQNMENLALDKNNTSGYRGVSWNKECQKWKAYVGHNRQMIYLGLYQTAEKAAEAAAAKRSELFTHDSGRDKKGTYISETFRTRVAESRTECSN